MYSLRITIATWLLLFSAHLAADAETEKILDLWDYNDPKSTEMLFISLTEEAAASQNKEYAPILLSQIARTYSLRGDFDTAHKVLNEAKDMLSGDENASLVFYHLERGRTLNSSGDKTAALKYFKQAFLAAEKIKDDYLAVDAAHMVAIAEELSGQMNWNVIALGIAENSKSSRARDWRGSLYNNMGWTFFDQESYNEALTMFEKGVDFRREKEQARRLLIARWAVARTYRALDRLDDALGLQLELLRETSAKGLPDDGYVVEELAEIYYLKGNPRASEYFARAYRILAQDEWLLVNEPDRLERLQKLSVRD
jgi:tetratricopeptide (TPR) repeat protein